MGGGVATDVVEDVYCTNRSTATSRLTVGSWCDCSHAVSQPAGNYARNYARNYA